MDGDLRNAARILFSDDILAFFSDETLAILRSKHPSHNKRVLLSNHQSSLVPCLQITEEQKFSSITSFPNGLASGIDGITSQDLKDLVSVSAGEAGREPLRD